MVLSYHVLFCGLGLVLLSTVSESQRRNQGTNCLKSTLPRNVKSMLDSCVQKAKNECSSGSSNRSDSGDTCSIPKSWTKLCPCMIEEMQKIFGSCCNTNSCNRTIEKRSLICIYNKSTEVLSSFYSCCEQLNSFWYRRLNKVLFMALKDFLGRKYGESSGIQTSSRTIQNPAAQEICADLSESEFVESSKQPYNCSTSERMLLASHCTFHSLVHHLKENCDNEEDDDNDDRSEESDNSNEMEEQCESLGNMMFTRWKENLTLSCDAIKQFEETVHMAMEENRESSDSSEDTTTAMPTTRRPLNSRRRGDRGRKG